MNLLKNRRNLLWLLPLVLFLLSPLWIPGVKAFLKPRGTFATPSQDGRPRGKEFVMDDITITMSSKGRVEWIVDAGQAFTIRSDREIGMTGVKALYTAPGQEKTYITSRRGRYEMNRGHLTLIDDVVIRKPAKQQELYTDLFHYYNRKRKVVCPEDVELRGPDFTIRAGRMDYDLARARTVFSKRVRVELKSEQTI